MLSPEEYTIHSDKITFRYKAEDNVKIENCTFELYNYSNRDGELEYSQTNTNLNNNQTIEITLQNFKETRYSWNVYCCDNSSNCNDDFDYDKSFEVSLSWAYPDSRYVSPSLMYPSA